MPPLRRPLLGALRLPQRTEVLAVTAAICVVVPVATWAWRLLLQRQAAATARKAKLDQLLQQAEDSDAEDEAYKDDKVWKKVEAVLAEYSLSNLGMAAAKKWVRMMGDPNNAELSRIRDWLLMRVNGRTRAPPPTSWQAGCPEIFAGLRAEPIWDASKLEWLRPFEANFEAVRDELLALRTQRGFQPLKIPTWASKNNSLKSPDGAGSVSHDAGDWNVFYLHLHEVSFPENLERCPVTAGLLKGLGNRSYAHAFFSALTPGTHILKHHGPTNKKLRVHMPLIGAAGSELRVADQIVRGAEGKCFVFDDSFEHEAWHKGDSTRIVLVFDVWHPDLTDKEVQFLSFLQRARMRAEMAAEKAARAARAEKALQAGGVAPPDDPGDKCEARAYLHAPSLSPLLSALTLLCNPMMHTEHQQIVHPTTTQATPHQPLAALPRGAQFLPASAGSARHPPRQQLVEVTQVCGAVWCAHKSLQLRGEKRGLEGWSQKLMGEDALK